jgi:hypothetical protein
VVGAPAREAAVSTTIEVWIGAALTLMVFSFLWRDNPFYKFAEHLFVGVTAAYWMVMGFWSTLWPNGVVKLVPAAIRVTDPAAPRPPAEPLVLVPVLLGVFMLLRLWPRYAWLARWPTAFAVGATLGYNLVRVLRSNFVHQISATVSPGLVVADPAGVAWGATINQWLMVAGTASGLAYFTYTRRGGGTFGRLARLGLWFLMVAFGASFAYAVMGRVTVLVGRLRFLLETWLGVT